jgi:ribosomal-protein-alanine N-acetyltransferase
MKVSAQDLYDIEGWGMHVGSLALEARWSLEDYVSELASPQGNLFFCEEPLGFVLYRSLGEGEIEIMNMAVREKSRGHGRVVMSRFLNSLEDSTKKIFLEVRASNLAAIKLYESFAFQKVGQRPRYYKNGETAVLMLKVL